MKVPYMTVTFTTNLKKRKELEISGEFSKPRTVEECCINALTTSSVYNASTLKPFDPDKAVNTVKNEYCFVRSNVERSSFEEIIVTEITVRLDEIIDPSSFYSEEDDELTILKSLAIPIAVDMFAYLSSDDPSTVFKFSECGFMEICDV